MGARIQKIKTHVKDHKEAYIAGTIGIAVGAVAVLLYKKDDKVKPKINQIMSYKPEATLEVYIEALGDPGNIVQDTTTGSIYASQRQAADAIGVDPASMSKHLNGRTEHLNGHKFEVLGKAMVPVSA